MRSDWVIGPWLARIGLLLAFIVVGMALVGLVEAVLAALQKWWGKNDDG